MNFALMCGFTATVILAWAVHCILSPKVSDGIVGKIFYIGAAICAAAELLTGMRHADPLAYMAFFVACIFVRHFWVYECWPLIVRTVLAAAMLANSRKQK